MLKHYLLDSAPVDRSTLFEARRWRRRFMAACHGFWAVLAACIGIVGVLQFSHDDPGSVPDNTMAVIFGGVLCSFVIFRFYCNTRRLASPSRAEMRQVSRRDSHAVYSLLFLLVGAHEIGALLNGASVAGTAGDLRGYVTGGVCALLLIRCSGFFWLKSLREPAAEQEPRR